MAKATLYIITNSYPEEKRTFNTDEFEYVINNYSSVKILSFSKTKSRAYTPHLEHISFFNGIKEIINPSHVSRRKILSVMQKETYFGNFIDFFKNIYSFILTLGILRNNKIQDNDLVFAYWFSRASRIAYYIYKLNGTKYICQGHGSDIYIYPPNNAKKIVGSAVKIITVGEESKKYISNKYNIPSEKILVYRLGIKQEFYKMIQKKVNQRGRSFDSKLVFLTVASYRYVKGIDLLLEAINLLVKNKKINDNILFKIYGSGNQKKRYIDYIKRMNLKNYIILNDWIDRENLSNELASANAFILPSRSEGLPVVLMEACAAGLPIIATNVGCVKEIAIDNFNAILCENVTSQSIANAIENFINIDSSTKYIYSKNSLDLFTKHYILEENLKNKYDYIISNINS